MGVITDNLMIRLGFFRFRPLSFPLLCAADVLCVAGQLLPFALVYGRKLRRKILKSVQIKVHVGDVDYFCRVPDICTVYEIWKKEVYQRLHRFIPSTNNVIVDVGANIGEYTLFAAKSVGESGKVISFEPHAEASDLLKKNLTSNNMKNVKLICKAACEKSGTVKIYSNPDTNALDSVNPSTNGYYVAKATTLDAVLRKEKRIDLLKIDIEGGEYLALKGAKSTLRKKPRIVVELHDPTVRTKVLDLLKHFGYSLVYEFFLVKDTVSIAYLEASN